MKNQTLNEFYHPKKETLYPFRSLTNYKAMHVKAAEKKGKREQFLAAPTLTAARQIVFGR